MSKRSPGHKRNKHDAYPTPYKAILPLLPHLEPATRFIEPCAGDGRLIGYLQEHGHICEAAFDIAPLDPCILPIDARYLRANQPYEERTIITNPPWSRDILHPLIVHLSMLHATWLIFDADWGHTQQARPFLEYCHKIVSVGRVRWLEGTNLDQGTDGKDNCSWYLFTAVRSRPGPTFYGRDGDATV